MDDGKEHGKLLLRFVCKWSYCWDCAQSCRDAGTTLLDVAMDQATHHNHDPRDPSIQIIPRIMENQMEKKMENEMETRVIIGVILGSNYTNNAYIGPSSL